MRRRYIWRDHQWLELDLSRPTPKPVAPTILRDLGSYRSTITGEQIEGRAQHREHLRQHDCVEVGNDYVTPGPAPLPPTHDDLRAALEASPETHAEARAAAERAAEVTI